MPRMPRQFITGADRVVFALIGLWAVATGVLFLLDHSAERTVWLNNLWNVMFVAGGFLTLAYAIDTGSWSLRALSNAVVVVACAGRGSGLALGLLRLAGWVRTDVPIDGTSIPRLIAGVGVYTMLAFTLYLVWRSRLPVDGGPHGAH